LLASLENVFEEKSGSESSTLRKRDEISRELKIKYYFVIE